MNPKNIAVWHLKKAYKNISDMLEMINNEENYLDILTKSKETQLEIKTAKSILLINYLKKCTKDFVTHRNNNRIPEIMKVFKYR